MPSPRTRGEGITSSAADLVTAVVRPEIRALSAYAVAKAGDDALNAKYRKDAPFVDPNIPINAGGGANRKR